MPGDGSPPDRNDKHVISKNVSDNLDQREVTRVEHAEVHWIVIAAVSLGIFLVAAFVVTFLNFDLVPGTKQRATPAQLLSTAAFATPGVEQTGPNQYAAYVVAQTWHWEPYPMRFPVGSEVTFYVTSADVLHGFHVLGSNANVMAIPSQVAVTITTFPEAGEFYTVCNEYCGVGHQDMLGKVIVEPRDAFSNTEQTEAYRADAH